MSPDRERALLAYLSEARKWRFHPVNAHCAHFILGALEATTGELQADILSRLSIVLPDTEIGVARLLVERGGMRGIAAALFGGSPRADILNAREGDIAVLDGDAGETLGLVEGGGVLCVEATAGLMRVPLDQARGFWSADVR